MTLYVLVEGDMDQRFFRSVLEPYFKENWQFIKYWNYQNKKKEKIKNFLRTIISVDGWDYIFVRDFDQHPCITYLKEKYTKKHPELDSDKIYVVKKEIESWYAAGITEEIEKLFGVEPMESTNEITKEDFNQLIPNGVVSTDFLIEILNNYSIDDAIEKNYSLSYIFRNNI